MSWLEAARPQIEARIKAMLAERPFSPDLAFDFDQVKAAVEIVEAALNDVHVAAQEATQARGLDAVARAGAAAAAGEPFSFINEGFSTGNAAILGNALLTFPRILRGSLFIAICSHTEHVLRAWCRWLHDRWSLPTELTKKSSGNNDLDRCMRYLRDEARLALAGYETWPEWPIVDNCRVARNCLAHDGGIVPDEHLERLRGFSLVEIDEEGLVGYERSIHLLPGSCHTAVDTAKAFFDRLSKIAAQHPNANRA